MKWAVLLFSMIQMGTCVMAQNYLGDTREWIIKSLISDSDSSYNIALDSSENVLLATISGQYSIRSEFHFPDEAGGVMECDSVTHRYACGPCFDGALEKLLSDPSARWLLMHEDRFIKPRTAFRAKDQGSDGWTTYTEMLTVVRSPEQETCGTLIFSYLGLPPKTRRLLVKNLICSGMFYPFPEE